MKSYGATEIWFQAENSEEFNAWGLLPGASTSRDGLRITVELPGTEIVVIAPKRSVL